MRKLTVDDIVDHRAYERERDTFRAHIIEMKKHRRIALGELVTIVFENTDTMRFQVQEMARAERMLTDEAIQTELDTYNPLIPEPGNLSATLFIELTSDDQLRGWLPKLVGIEHSPELRLSDGSVVRSTPDPAHAAQLTREEITASVHYVSFPFTDAQVAAFAAGPVRLAINHPNYGESVELLPATVAELLTDLRG
jgi:hypothetical protein